LGGSSSPPIHSHPPTTNTQTLGCKYHLVRRALLSPNVASPLSLTNTPAHTQHPLHRLGSNTHHPNRPTHQASRFRRKPDVPLSPRRLETRAFATALASPLTPPPPLGLLGRRLVSPRLLPLAPRPSPPSDATPSFTGARCPPHQVLSLTPVCSFGGVVFVRRFASSAAASRSACRTRDAFAEDERGAGDGRAADRTGGGGR
jgi:hypothetical protein